MIIICSMLVLLMLYFYFTDLEEKIDRNHAELMKAIKGKEDAK